MYRKEVVLFLYVSVLMLYMLIVKLCVRFTASQHGKQKICLV